MTSTALVRQPRPGLLARLASALTRGVVTTTSTVGWSIVRGTTPSDFQGTGGEVRRVGWERHPVVNACIRVVADLIAAVPLEVYRKDAGESVVLPDHEALGVFHGDGTRRQSEFRLKARIATHFLTYGNAFALIERRGASGPPRGLRLIPPDAIQHVWLNAVDDRIHAYDWRDLQGTTHAREPVENLIHFRDLDASDGLFGFPRFASALRSILADSEASEYVRQVVTNHGAPGLAVMIEGTTTADELRAAEEKFREKWVTRGNRGATAFMAGVKELVPIGFNLAELEFPDLRGVTREDICTAANVDPRIIGVQGRQQDGGLSGEQFREARHRLIQQTVYPVMRCIEDELNWWLMPEFGDVFVRFSEEYIAAITEDVTTTSARVIAEVGAKIRTVEEAREAVGLDADMDPTHTMPGGLSVGDVASNAQAMSAAMLEATKNPPPVGGASSRDTMRYDPSQPRDPKGTSTGGQWTAAGGGHFPLAGDTVDGLTVGKGPVANTDSISGVSDDTTVLQGIREVPMSAFEGDLSINSFYAKDDRDRVKALAAKIEQSGRIDPLIVVVDSDGPYILEGSHRVSALHYMGKKSFPALVVIDNSKTRSSKVGGRAALVRAASWDDFNARAAHEEDAFIAEALAQFRAEASLIEDIVQRTQTDAAFRREVLQLLAQYSSGGAIHDAWLRRFQPLIRRVMASGGKAVSDEIGIRFDLENPRARAVIRQRGAEMVQHVTDTTKEAIRGALEVGRASGLGVRETARMIHETTFGEITKARAQTIARTETIGALNAGEYTAAVQSGVLRSKTWLSSKDAKVRDTHAAIDEDTIDIGAAFRNGLRYPHEPGAPAGEVVNCRCTLLYSDREAGSA